MSVDVAVLERRPGDSGVGQGESDVPREGVLELVNGGAIGVDPLSVMIRQARRRNAAAISAGRVVLICAAVYVQAMATVPT